MNIQERLISLDFLRGATIIGMIIVNDPGSWAHVYKPLLHAQWNGATVTDLIFPFFLFVVGVSISLAYTKRLQKNEAKRSLVKKILQRTLVIMLLGWFLALFPKFEISNIRLVGVLPRISIVFMVCALLFLYTSWKQQLKIAVGILLLYYLLLMFVPLPGYGRVVLEPGLNMAAWIDQWIVPGRMYRGTWDPEGFVSTLPAIVTGISGMLVGRIWLVPQAAYRKLVYLFVVGFLLYIAGLVWSWHFPLNKNLWTSSYVLYTSGLATMSFATSIYVVDVIGIRAWTKPALIFGANAIFAFVLHGVLFRVFVLDIAGKSTIGWFMHVLTSLGFSMKLASFSWALFYTFLCFLPVWYLYDKKIFLKI